MKIKEITETTSSGSVAAMSGVVGTTIKRSQAYNKDGTMKNALDVKETNKKKYGNSIRKR